MTEKIFEIEKELFDRRKLTILQHKIRVVLKCYTIRNFKITDENKFTFNPSYRVNKIKIDSSKELEGSFTVQEINNKVRLKIIV